MAEVDELREAVEREYPRYDDREGDWDEVLRRAATPPPRRSKWIFRGVVVAGAAAVVVALLLVAPWRAENGIVDRALAAVDDGPVLHVVVRSDIEGKLVHLASGRSRPVYDEQELWWDPARGLHQISRFAGRAYVDRVSRSPGSGRGVLTGETDVVALGFVRGYREALESGDAEEAGEGEIAGRKVTWIRFREGDGFTIEVAVDRDTARPVYARSRPGGAPAEPTGHTVLVAESLPEDAGNFDTESTPPPIGFYPGGAASGAGAAIRPAQARRILGRRPLWLGERHRGLPFVGYEAPFVMPGTDPRNLRYIGVDVLYGEAARRWTGNQTGWLRVGQYPRLEFTLGFMEPNEDKAWRAIRPGFVLVFAGFDPLRTAEGVEPIAGYLKHGGLYVKLLAPNEKQIVPAARALRPMPR